METIAMMNPFVVGRYVSDKYFCDREGETSFLIKQIEKSLIYWKPNSTGRGIMISFKF